jgi:hypothetical protein
MLSMAWMHVWNLAIALPKFRALAGVKKERI